ncbi:uncharacterized protein LAESUDRAFT_764971 [Laetiporus sulphureus 93-53]|uniref:Uncharacterized protein n=1 Tax=Laetiporus sulphureus 93-53 TaxID=1314785 RepID=A0A165B1P2_9APHY|nr:uncharacterized protein LAESUDRAFT_764971 [Laetiporus sulphureus 93-53]KZT00065.1 hypothetical protein LAESUDRAFT_764971 [Laetiporus sulphureus 93-53]
MAPALNFQVSISLHSNDIDSSANKRARALSTAPTSYQPPPPSFTTGCSPSTTTEFSPFSTTGFSPLKSILQASHICHACTPSPDHNGLRVSKRMQNTAMGRRRRRRRAVVGSQGARMWARADVGIPGVRSHPSRKHSVSFVRRYHIPCTQRDDSTTYGHAIIAVNVASRMRSRLQGRPTVASGATAGGRGGDLTERIGGREWT